MGIGNRLNGIIANRIEKELKISKKSGKKGNHLTVEPKEKRHPSNFRECHNDRCEFFKRFKRRTYWVVLTKKIDTSYWKTIEERLSEEIIFYDAIKVERYGYEYIEGHFCPYCHVIGTTVPIEEIERLTTGLSDELISDMEIWNDEWERREDSRIERKEEDSHMIVEPISPITSSPDISLYNWEYDFYNNEIRGEIDIQRLKEERYIPPSNCPFTRCPHFTPDMCQSCKCPIAILEVHFHRPKKKGYKHNPNYVSDIKLDTIVDNYLWKLSMKSVKYAIIESTCKIRAYRKRYPIHYSDSSWIDGGESKRL